MDRPPLTDADFAAATRTLAAPNMLVLRTEQLDILGWDKLAAWLAGTRAARLLGIVARQRSAVGSANGTVVKFNNGSWVYTPTAAEKERVCVVNHFDCKLYGSVGVGLHPYHIDNRGFTLKGSGRIASRTRVTPRPAPAAKDFTPRFS